MAYKFIVAGQNVFQGNILDIFKNQALKQDINGRSNFIILGTSEDDPDHGGADLTDSILVVSIDQKNKNAYIFNVPRDLYVKYGMACFSGYAGKINEYFMCSAEDEQARLNATQKFIGDIFGLDIQYGVHVNHTVIKDVVNAIGGIDVDIQGSNGNPGVYDRNFDWRCNYKCYLVKYDNGVHHLDGEHALFLAMARGDTAPTYGLGNSNFDREKNQQKILIAIRDKALSTGALTNLGTITGIIDALGNNLRTNIQSAEIRTLTQVASEIKSADIHTLSLFGEDGSVVTTGSYGGASVVMPSAGIFEYSEIQNFIKKSVTNDPVARENAPIVVLNGTGQTGYGKTKADLLTTAGYNISLVDTAPDGTYENVEIYQIGTDNPATAEKLATLYGVTIKKIAPPTTVNGDVRFVIIFGSVTN
jgi:LCP family protein required for cell wall assembly